MAADFARHRAPHENSRRGLHGNGAWSPVAFATVQPGWDQLGSPDRERILRTLIANVVYTASNDQVDIELRCANNGNADGAV